MTCLSNFSFSSWMELHNFISSSKALLRLINYISSTPACCFARLLACLFIYSCIAVTKGMYGHSEAWQNPIRFCIKAALHNVSITIFAYRLYVLLASLQNECQCYINVSCGAGGGGGHTWVRVPVNRMDLYSINIWLLLTGNGGF